MTAPLKLFVWEGAFSDHADGVMFALADSVEEARAEILKACHYVPANQLDREPTVIETPRGFAVWDDG